MGLTRSYMQARDYPWLTVAPDGRYEADMGDTTAAEMDRRIIIMQELAAGRVTLAAGAQAMPEEGQ